MLGFETLVKKMEKVTGFSITTILFSFVVSFIAVKLYKKMQSVNLVNKIPGPKGLPLLGNLVQTMVSPAELFNVLTTKFPISGSPISRFWLGWHPYVMIYEAKTVEVVLRSSKHLYKTTDYDLLHSWLGQGLLTSSGDLWHSRRKMLTPAFHFKILEEFVDIMNSQSFVLVDQLKAHADNGDSFDMMEYATLCTLDIILESAMGCNISSQKDPRSEYAKAVRGFGEIWQWRQFNKVWFRNDFLFKFSSRKKEFDEIIKILHDFSYRQIKERKKLRQQMKLEEANNKEQTGKKKKLAFLDLLLQYSEEGANLSDTDIREEVDTFMFEGHDTTAAAFNWTIYLLGITPNIQEKLYEEIESVMGKDPRTSITTEDLKKMNYLDCVTKEALRLFPSVPLFGRELKEEMTVEGYKIPVGTAVLVNVCRLHKDPKVFADPEDFNPDRFLPTNSVDRHPFAYVPFSAGPRNCIGQKFAQTEDKIVVANLIRNYRVECLVKREDMKVTGQLVVRPENGNPVQIFNRH